MLEIDLFSSNKPNFDSSMPRLLLPNLYQPYKCVNSAVSCEKKPNQNKLFIDLFVGIICIIPS